MEDLDNLAINAFDGLVVKDISSSRVDPFQSINEGMSSVHRIAETSVQGSPTIERDRRPLRK